MVIGGTSLRASAGPCWARWRARCWSAATGAPGSGAGRAVEGRETLGPNEATSLTGVVKKAYEQGIAVLVLDRKVDGDAYTSFIGADDVDIERQAGECFKQHLLPQGGKIVELKGLAGSTPAKERAEGGIKAVEAGRLSATFSYPTGAEAVAAAKKLLVDCGQLPKTQKLPTRRITKDNAAQAYAELNPGS
ncbi:substrate-binding domain-containing protein [Amycolatopsis sp. NPDC004368]